MCVGERAFNEASQNRAAAGGQCTRREDVLRDDTRARAKEDDTLLCEKRVEKYDDRVCEVAVRMQLRVDGSRYARGGTRESVDERNEIILQSVSVQLDAYKLYTPLRRLRGKS